MEEEKDDSLEATHTEEVVGDESVVQVENGSIDQAEMFLLIDQSVPQNNDRQKSQCIACAQLLAPKLVGDSTAHKKSARIVRQRTYVCAA